MAASVLKLTPNTYDSLQQMSQEDGTPMSSIVDMLVKRYERERFWQRVEDDLARFKADPVAWQAYQDEFSIWDRATVADGLADEPPYYEDGDEL